MALKLPEKNFSESRKLHIPSAGAVRPSLSASARTQSNFALLQRRAAATASRISLEESPWRQGGTNRPGDRHEAEAERVAKQVMAFRAGAGPSPAEQQSGAGQSRPLPLPATLHSPMAATGGQGQPLAKPLRSFFEQRFAHDFSEVRIHHNPQANAMAEGFDANAFTIGKNIFLADGALRPGNHESMLTLAHELTHVVQQDVGYTKNSTNTGHLVQKQTIKPSIQCERRRRPQQDSTPRERRRSQTGGYFYLNARHIPPSVLENYADLHDLWQRFVIQRMDAVFHALNMIAHPNSRIHIYDTYRTTLNCETVIIDINRIISRILLELDTVGDDAIENTLRLNYIDTGSHIGENLGIIARTELRQLVELLNNISNGSNRAIELLVNSTNIQSAASRIISRRSIFDDYCNRILITLGRIYSY